MSTKDKMVLCECGNRDWRGDVSECNEIHGLLDRVETGDEFPAGECPKCEALAYLARKGDDDGKGNVLRVIISVRGGVADVLLKPTGVALSVFDYDVAGEPHATEDPDGQGCFIGEWAAREQIINCEHWPIVKASRRDVTSSCIHMWKCPCCDKAIEHSYEALVEVGVPHCPQCEIEMTLV